MDLQEIIRTSVWQVAPVEEQPEIRLERWSVREIQPNGTWHFVGWNVAGEGRVSSAIVSFDPERLTGRTSSGRVYALAGAPGLDPDGEYVFSMWRRGQRGAAEEERNITKEVLEKYSH